VENIGRCTCSRPVTTLCRFQRGAAEVCAPPSASFVQMLQLALRQQQLHAAHMQIKLQHQSTLVVGEHNFHRHHHHHLQQQQEQGVRPSGVDQVGSPNPTPITPSVVACPSATSATWQTDDEPHTTTSPSTHTTSADQPSLYSITRVCTPLRVPLDYIILVTGVWQLRCQLVT